MTVDFEKLCAPFPPEVVSWRVGPTNKEKTKGMALAYVDARDVMRRLDEVAGPENWQTDYPWGDGKRVVCRIGIKVGDEWIWKADGAGDTDTEGEKGALSDAFKRAAVKWGIGRHLYDTDSPWVDIEGRGNSYFIPDRELARLRGILAGKKPPAMNGHANGHAADTRDKARAKEMATGIKAAIDAAKIPGDNALGLKLDGRKDREDVAFIRKHLGDGWADRLHELAAHKIVELSQRMGQ